MIWKLISLFFEPSHSKYHEAITITSDNLNDNEIPISKILLLKQPGDPDTIGIHIEYQLPKYCVSHSAKLNTRNKNGQVTTNLWLEASQVKNKNTLYFVHNIDNLLHETGEITFIFNDGRLPTSNTYQYRIILNEYEIT